MAELLKSSKAANDIYMLTAIVLVLIAMLLSIFISKSITHPIQKLRDSMKRVQEGDFTAADLPVPYENEIGSLDVFDLMDQLEWSEEAVWFLAGVYSREDAEYEQLLAEGDIHELLDFMVLNTARRAARLLTESITAEVLFVRFYIAENMEADQEPGLEDPAAYRRYIEEHMAVLNEVDPGKEQAYAWLSDRMPL